MHFSRISKKNMHLQKPLLAIKNTRNEADVKSICQIEHKTGIKGRFFYS